MNRPYYDKDPFTGENCQDKQCPVCKYYFYDLEKHARSKPDAEHAMMVVHSS